MLTPNTMKPGKHLIGELPEQFECVLSFINDKAARVALEVVDGLGHHAMMVDMQKPDKHFKKIWGFEFSPCGRYYCYNTDDSAGGVIDGKQPFGEQTIDLHVYSGIIPWSYRKKYGQKTHLVTSKGVSQNLINRGPRVTSDGKHVFFITPDEQLIYDDSILFDGFVQEYELCKNKPFVSWLGSPDIGENYYVYLEGERKAKVPYYCEVFTFHLSPNEGRFLYAGNENENYGDENNGDLFIYIDGEKLNIPWKMVEYNNMTFSPNSHDWSCICRNHNDKHVIVSNGKVSAEFDFAFDLKYSPDSRRLGCVGYYASSEELRKKLYLENKPLSRSCVFVDGKIIEFDTTIDTDSFVFSPDSKHYAFIAYKGDAGDDDRYYQVYLDGHVIFEDDYCFSVQSEMFMSGPVFSSDSKRIYFFSMSDDSLYFNVNEIK